MWIIAFLILNSATTAIEPVDSLIAAGRLAEAYESLESTFGETPDSAEYFLISGLSIESGENSASDLKDFINRGSGSSAMADWARSCLGKYYLSQNLYVAARKMFEQIPDTSPFAVEASYLEGKGYFQTGEFDKAEKIFQTATKQFNPSKNKSQTPFQNEFYWWSVLGLAETKAAGGDFSGAEKLYKQLLEPQFESNIMPLALLGLVKISNQAKKTGQATYYLDQYKDHYGQPPAGYGKTTQSPPGGADDSKSIDEKADKLLGNKYYVQIGVYSKKDNADKTAAMYKKNKYKTTVESFNKQGQVFYRVLLGSYNSKPQAEFIKERLEKAAGEKYILLVR
jgi:tetratricopeptide (TPR) repeat protein